MIWWPTWYVAALGAFLILLSWAARPPAGAPPDEIIEQSTYPVLYALAGRIAERIGAPAISGIAVSPRFNANYRVVRGRPYVELGASLIAILTPRELAAILAHELSHGANGDPLRGRLLFGAVRTLSTWAIAVRPLSIGNSADGVNPVLSIVMMPLEFALLGVSELLLLAAQGIVLLVLRDSQRCEYLADRLAANAAGHREMAAALEKLYLRDTVDIAIQHHVLTDATVPIGLAMKAAIGAVTEEHLCSLRERSLAEKWQVDASHPPTAMRVRMLSAGVPSSPPDLMSGEEESELIAEVDRLVASQQRRMIDGKLETLYS